MFGLSVRCCAQARKALLPHVELGTDPFQNGILSDIDTVRPVYTLTCPNCAHQATEAMPTDACRFFYDCMNCGARLKPKPGDCCVFCSYGSVPCPPRQAGNCCGPSCNKQTAFCADLLRPSKYYDARTFDLIVGFNVDRNQRFANFLFDRIF